MLTKSTFEIALNSRTGIAKFCVNFIRPSIVSMENNLIQTVQYPKPIIKNTGIITSKSEDIYCFSVLLDDVNLIPSYAGSTLLGNSLRSVS